MPYKLNKEYLGAFITISLIAVILVARCFYSFCWSDEGFYLSLVHRFWVGDRPFVDEWSGVQLYTVVLLPIYALYRFIVGSSDGVYLLFRIFMVLCNYLLSLYIYRILKSEYGNCSAVCGAILYFLYTRANIQGVSYYSFAVFFFTWSLCLLFDIRNRKRKGISFFLIGCTLAMTVVALPYFGICYIVLWIIGISLKRYRKYRKNLFFIGAGSVLCAGVYLAFILSHISFWALLESSKYLFEDSEHSINNIFFSLPLWFIRIIYRYKYTSLISCIIIVFILYNKYLKKRELNNRVRYIIITLSIIIYLINIAISKGMLGCAYIAISQLALTLYLLTLDGKNMGDTRGVRIIFIPGILFSIIFHMSSNTGLDSMTTGFAICAVIAPEMIISALKKNQDELVQKERFVRGLIAFLFLLCILQTGYLRVFGVYRDDNLALLNSRIEEGPAKYLYTTKEHNRQYEEIYEILNKSSAYGKEGTIVITEMVPWAYLCLDRSYGSPSPCRFWGGINELRLKEYYSLMPEKVPQYILAVKENYGNFKSVLLQGNEESLAPNGTGVADWLLKEVKKRGYKQEDVSCGVIYYQP